MLGVRHKKKATRNDGESIVHVKRDKPKMLERVFLKAIAVLFKALLRPEEFEPCYPPQNAASCTKRSLILVFGAAFAVRETSHLDCQERSPLPTLRNR